MQGKKQCQPPLNSGVKKITNSFTSKQLKRAGRSGARWALLIGDAEAAVSEVILRDLRANENAAKDTQVPIAELTARLP